MKSEALSQWYNTINHWIWYMTKFWHLLVKGKGVVDCYCLLCICVICLLQIICGSLVFVISCYDGAWCLVFVWLSSLLGGMGGFEVRIGEHELRRSKEGLYEEVPNNVMQVVELSTWNLVVVVYMWLLNIGFKFFFGLLLQVRIIFSIDGGEECPLVQNFMSLWHWWLFTMPSAAIEGIELQKKTIGLKIPKGCYEKPQVNYDGWDAPLILRGLSLLLRRKYLFVWEFQSEVSFYKSLTRDSIE